MAKLLSWMQRWFNFGAAETADWRIAGGGGANKGGPGTNQGLDSQQKQHYDGGGRLFKSEYTHSDLEKHAMGETQDNFDGVGIIFCVP